MFTWFITCPIIYTTISAFTSVRLFVTAYDFQFLQFFHKIWLVKVAWYALRVKNMHFGSLSDTQVNEGVCGYSMVKIWFGPSIWYAFLSKKYSFLLKNTLFFNLGFIVVKLKAHLLSLDIFLKILQISIKYLRLHSRNNLIWMR